MYVFTIEYDAASSNIVVLIGTAMGT